MNILKVHQCIFIDPILSAVSELSVDLLLGVGVT